MEAREDSVLDRQPVQWSHPGGVFAVLLGSIVLFAGCEPETIIDDDDTTDVTDDDTDDDDDTTEPPPTRIYATFFSHNEQAHSDEDCSILLNGGATEEEWDQTLARENYLANREATLDLAQRFIDHDVAWHLQSDWEYARAVEHWDQAPELLDVTDGKNLLQYIHELSPDHLQVDAHAHESSHNYADVSYVLDQLGVPSTGVIGGYLANPPEEENWTRFQDGPLMATPTTDTSYAFDVGFLTGGGSVSHDQDIIVSGVWRPMDADHYTDDDPTQQLIAIGGHHDYLPEGNSVLDLVTRLDAGELEDGVMYTATVMFKHCDLASDEDLVDSLEQVIIDHQADVEAGKLVWATVPQLVQAWQDEYGSRVELLVEDSLLED